MTNGTIESIEERCWLEVKPQHPELIEPVACSILDKFGKEAFRWLGEGQRPEGFRGLWQQTLGVLPKVDDEESYAEEVPPFDVIEQWEDAYRLPLVFFVVDRDFKFVRYVVRWEVGRGLVFKEAQRGSWARYIARMERDAA
jgi:hypothetical protein